jgi:hypothetical protein
MPTDTEIAYQFGLYTVQGGIDKSGILICFCFLNDAAHLKTIRFY